MRKRYQITLAICIGAIFGVILWPLPRLREPIYHGRNTVIYKGKPLEAWFYGSNTTFFSKRTRVSAQVALKAAGTNAFPFLLSRLKERRGDRTLYREAYRAMPPWMQGRLPYPLSGDDIKYVALDHLRAMGESLTRKELDALADCVPSLRNPVLRMKALSLLTACRQPDPGFHKLRRKLLNNDDPGIRLEAALQLAESGVAYDPANPRLFSILLSGLESKEIREHWVEIDFESNFQPQPTGSPRKPVSVRLGVVPETMLQSRVWKELERLKPYLAPEQTVRLSQVEKARLYQPQQIR